MTFNVKVSVLLKEAKRNGALKTAGFSLEELLYNHLHEHLTMSEFISVVEIALDEEFYHPEELRWTLQGESLYRDALEATGYFFNCPGVAMHSWDEDLPF